jgi:thiamine-phosphate pyrophosphorylase
MKAIGKLCVITDTVVQSKYSHFDIAEMAIKGGADIIQFREKNMNTKELVEKAIIINNLCKNNGVRFIVNDRADVTLVSEADGVHLGKEDISVKEARALLGPDRIIGATAHTLVEAIDAVEQGADYIGYGHVFPTYTKKKTTMAKGLESLKQICTAIKIPVFAIGGIDLENAKAVMLQGAFGIAVVGAVVKSPDPLSAVKELRRIIYG